MQQSSEIDSHSSLSSSSIIGTVDNYHQSELLTRNSMYGEGGDHANLSYSEDKKCNIFFSLPQFNGNSLCEERLKTEVLNFSAMKTDKKIDLEMSLNMDEVGSFE